MSYDIAFFHDTPKCNHSAYGVYCRLRNGLNIPGLRKIKRNDVVATLSKILNTTETSDARLVGQLGNAFIEVTLLDDAVLFELRNMEGSEITQLEDAFRPLELWLFDPQAYHYYGDHRAELYDLIYEEESHDPDPKHWVDVNITKDSIYQISNSLIGYQEVNQIRYVFYNATFSKIKDAVDASETWLKPKMLTDSRFTGDKSSLTALVQVPLPLIQQLSSDRNSRIHLTGFTAFADNDNVLRHGHWKTDFDGTFAGIYSLPSMPTKIKTIISQQYCFKG